MSGFAAVDNGCDKDGADYINPELALCSTHVYNIGGVENPRNDSERQIMKDVVALKTTVMTQQMYKQYEYLESMIRRFKTQLEKAVLTTKLQAAGADTSAAGSSSYSGVSASSSNTNAARAGTNRYIVLSDAKNCNLESTVTSAMQCLLDNISMTLSAIDASDFSNARRQLDADMEVAERFGISKPQACKSLSNSMKSLSACSYALRSDIMIKIEEKQKVQTKQNMSGGFGG